NANGFPITKDFCGTMRLDVYELDGGANYSLDPSLTQWDQMELIDQDDLQANSLAGTANVTFANGNHTVVLNITIPAQQHYDVVGAMIGPDGSVVKAKFPLATSIVDPTADHYRPVVASDGTNFMTAWELPGRRQSGLVFSIDENIVRRRFDASGNPLTNDEFMT